MSLLGWQLQTLLNCSPGSGAAKILNKSVFLFPYTYAGSKHFLSKICQSDQQKKWTFQYLLNIEN